MRLDRSTEVLHASYFNLVLTLLFLIEIYREREMAEAGSSVKAIEPEEEEFEDESLAERLYGLTEMFPGSVCNGVSVVTSASLKGLKMSYSFSRSALWIATTSFMVLMLPVIFETEMAQMEQAQLQKQRQILLGPNAGMSGGGGIPGGMTPPIPGMPR